LISIGEAIFILAVVWISYSLGRLSKEKEFDELGMYLPKNNKK